MTMTEDVIFAPASNQDSTIVPEGRWRLELKRIEAAPPSSFSEDKSPRAKWVFNLYAEMVETLPKGEQFFFNGEPYELFRHTSLKNSPRAFARKFSEALLGRPLAEGEIPSKTSLIGRSMSAVISYDAGTIDPNQQVLNLSSIRPAAAPAKAAPVAPPRPAPGQIAADASDEDIDRAFMVSTLTRKVEQAEKLGTPGAPNFRAALNMIGQASVEQIENILANAKAEVDAALAALAD